MTKEEAINCIIKESGADTNKISDGYHTFEELYEHRIMLYINLCRLIKDRAEQKGLKSPVWKCTMHSDGTVWDGWFILGVEYGPGVQITYHLPMDKWDLCIFFETLHRPPLYDGHTSKDVLDRLWKLAS